MPRAKTQFSPDSPSDRDMGVVTKPRVSVTGAVSLATVAAAVCLNSTAAAEAHPDFAGVWSGFLTTSDDPYWQVDELLCFAGCPTILVEPFTAWLDNPANDNKPLERISEDLGPALMAQLADMLTPEGQRLRATHTVESDPALHCKPDGLVRAATNPLPMIIREEADAIVIEYEKWEQSRTIHMDGRGYPVGLEPTLLGYSIGRWEDGALVVETVGVVSYPYQPAAPLGAHSDQARFEERYEILDAPRRLRLTLTITDPVTVREPLVFKKQWLSTPDVELMSYECIDATGIP